MLFRSGKVALCVLNATQCAIPELVALTKKLQGLRQRLGTGDGLAPRSATSGHYNRTRFSTRFPGEATHKEDP